LVLLAMELYALISMSVLGTHLDVQSMKLVEIQWEVINVFVGMVIFAMRLVFVSIVMSVRILQPSVDKMQVVLILLDPILVDAIRVMLDYQQVSAQILTNV